MATKLDLDTWGRLAAYQEAKTLLREAPDPVWAPFHTGILAQLDREETGPSSCLWNVYARSHGVGHPQILKDLSDCYPKTIVVPLEYKEYYEIGQYEGLLTSNYACQVSSGLLVFRARKQQSR